MTDRVERGSVRRGARVAAAERVLRAGGLCRIPDTNGAIGILAIDALDDDRFERHLREDQARLVLTGSRAQTLGLVVPAASSVALRFEAPPPPALFASLINPFVRPRASAGLEGVVVEHAGEAERAGIALAKRAGLLPAVFALSSTARAEISVSAADLLAQQKDDVESLAAVVETPLPTSVSEQGRLVVFRSPAMAAEHLALVIGEPRKDAPTLCRLHSECLTGDVFGSLRCDCGEQLNGAMRRMAAEGGGVLLYLRQEGRGIGLVNKLRAYRLQDQGLDTVDANTHLGFEPDERDFAIAAQMLNRLGLRRIRLLTNNPEKLAALASHGVEVTERVPLAFAANRHNHAYLETKARRAGHLLRVIDGGLHAHRHAELSGG